MLSRCLFLACGLWPRWAIYDLSFRLSSARSSFAILIFAALKSMCFVWCRCCLLRWCLTEEAHWSLHRFSVSARHGSRFSDWSSAFWFCFMRLVSRLVFPASLVVHLVSGGGLSDCSMCRVRRVSLWCGSNCIPLLASALFGFGAKPNKCGCVV